MEVLIEKNIPKEYEILCAVNKEEEQVLFTEELIALLFLQ